MANLTFDKFWEAVDSALQARGERFCSTRGQVERRYRAFPSMTPDACAADICAVLDRKVAALLG